MEDRELIEKIIQGQEDLFSIIIDKYKNKVFSIIYSFCGQTSDCEDIAQNVFIKIFKALPKFKFESEFSTWMYRKKSNLIDFLKSNDNTERELMQKETQKMVQEALGKLKDNYKMVLTLRDIEDYSYEEIAKMMDASVENVKIWIFRARNRLKEILTEGGNLK